MAFRVWCGAVCTRVSPLRVPHWIRRVNDDLKSTILQGSRVPMGKNPTLL